MVPNVAQAEFSVSFLVFCVYTFILIGRPQDYLPALVPFRPALVFTIISLAVTVLMGQRGAANPLRHRSTKLYLVFYAVMVAGVPFSIHRRLSLDFALTIYIVNVVFFLLFLMNVNTLARFKRVVFVVVLAALMFSALGLQHGSFIAGRYGTVGLGFDPNDIAFVVVSLLSFAVCVLLGSFRWLAKTLALMTIAFGVLLALYTGSRGGLLGLGTFLALFLAIGVRGLSKTKKLFIVVVLAVIATLNADKINVNRYLTLGELESDYNTTEFGRVGIWRQGLRMFTDSPLTGVGVTRFGQAIGTMRMEDNLIPEWQAPHNSYVQVLAELGLLGAAAFLILIVVCVSTLGRLMRKPAESATVDIAVYAAVLLVGLIAQIVAAFFLSQAYSMFFTLAFAVSTALAAIAAAGGAAGHSGSAAAAAHLPGTGGPPHPRGVAGRARHSG